MRRYLLDTALVTAYLRGRSGAVSLIQPWIDADEAATSVLVYGEAIEFFKNLPDFPRRQALPRVFPRQIQTYDLTYAILEWYADVRRMMRSPFGPGQIGDMDTLIAATALVHDLTVVTIDSDFTRVPSFSVRHRLPVTLKS